MNARSSLLAFVLLPSLPAAQQSLGMAISPLGGGEVLVFDADTDTPLGIVTMPSLRPCGDCEILADLSLGFVVDFQRRVWVIDLTASPPALAAGTNPIPISNSGEDVVVSPDQRYLLVSDGNLPEPLSIIDIAARAEIGTIAPLTDCNSVDVASDGSILVTSLTDGLVARLSLDAFGNVTDTGERLTIGGPNNSYFSPDGAYGVTFRRNANRVVSYTTPGLVVVDDTALQGTASERGACGAFDPNGQRLFTMSTFSDILMSSSAVSLHGFDAATGEVADTPVWTTSLTGGIGCYGVEQLALHPNGEKLYVARWNTSEVSILDADDGSEIGTLTLRDPASVCVRQLAECFLVVGDGSGDAAFDAGGHTWQTQLGSVASSYPVTLDEMPSFPLPELPLRVTTMPPTKVQELDVQVLMWNPTVFPGNPEQWSHRLHVTVWSNGRVTSRPLGTRDGIEIEHEVVRQPDGSRRVRFPFTIEGM